VSFVAASAFAQDADKARGKKKAGRPDREVGTSVSPEDQRASGVIVKAERVSKGATSRSENAAAGKGQQPTYQLTINPDIPWRDWVRDQAGIDPNASPKEAAARGASSVATEGEPDQPGSLVVIDVDPNTKVETRFRESNDETTRGAKDPAEAASPGGDRGSDKAGKGSAKRGEKGADRTRVTRFQAEDLKPGLFVEVDFRHREASNLASALTVIRPVGGSDSPIPPSSDEGKSKAKSETKSRSKSDQ